jgi:hypothetical protein
VFGSTALMNEFSEADVTIARNPVAFLYECRLALDSAVEKSVETFVVVYQCPLRVGSARSTHMRAYT